MERPHILSLMTLIFSASVPWAHGKFDHENFEEKLIVLPKVLGYIRHRPQQMNADVTLSITIVEANIAATLMHKNSRYLEPKYQDILGGILMLSHSTRLRLMENIIPEDKTIQLLHETLNNPVLWIRKILWRRGVLRKGSPTPGLTYRGVRDSIMRGSPTEEGSDRCLGEIVRNKLDSVHRLPDSCLEILMTGSPARGYPLTHRLLIVQVAKAMKVDRDVPFPLPDLIFSYCSAILQDLIDFEAAGFPYNTPDLMMEQALLCGMEGFLEFTGRHYEKLLLNWPHTDGCFSSFGSRYPRKEIDVVRRASRQTDYGCDSHATGLAAAALSLFIRENVENALND